MEIRVEFESQEGLKEAISKGFEKTVFDILADSKIACPVDTGALKSSLHTKKIKEDEYELISRLPYANRIEYGFIGRDKLGRFYFQRPVFFVKRSIFKNIPKIVDNIKMFSK